MKDYGSEGKAALMIAAVRNTTEGFKALIQAGANVNLKDNQDNTVLIRAVSLFEQIILKYPSCNRCREITRELVETGADLRFSHNKTILNCYNMMNVPEIKKLLENAMLKQLNQKVKIGYKDLRIEKADAEIARKLYKQPQYKDNEKLKETIKLFEIAIATYIGDIFLGAQLPIYSTEEKLFEGKLKPVQKEGTKIFITVPDNTPQKHAIRNDSKISDYSVGKSNLLGQNGVGSLLGKYLEIQDIGMLRQVSKIIKLDANQLTTDDIPAADIESPILGQEDENVWESIGID